MELDKDINIQSAGRSISDRNASRLLNAYNELGGVLSDANIISNKAEGNIKVLASMEAIEIQGESFRDHLDRISWHQRLITSLNEFRQRFTCEDYPMYIAVEDEDEDEDEKEEGDERLKLIDDLVAVLTELANQSPRPPKRRIDETMAKDKAMRAMHLAADQPEDETTEVEVVNEPVTEELTEFSIDFAIDVSNVIQAKAEKGSNKHPIQGVLFKIDQPSESTPSVGPGLPLYIPRAIAESLVDKVGGLPLDASDSLRVHASRDIVGTMTRAWINGGDFMVEGHLWQWNQPEKVATITANEGFLGMSLNAHANGHEEEIGGRKVFVIDKLDLLGANILRRDHATYQTTNLVSAESQQLSIPVAIAASAAIEDEWDDDIQLSIFNQEEKTTMDLSEQIFKLSSSLETFQKAYGDEIKDIQESLMQLSSSVATIQSERETLQAAARQEQTQAEKEAEQANLAKNITDVVLQAMDTRFKQFKNPSGQPQRITQSIPMAIAASQQQSASVSSEQMQLQLQLASIEGEIRGAEGDWTKMAKLTDEKRNVETRLQILLASGV
jgi:hypothetical protein